MAREILTLKQAAEHIHLQANELKHFAQRGEIEAFERNGEWFFEHRALDEWAQRDMLATGKKQLAARHREMMDENRKAEKKEWGVSNLFDLTSVSLCVTAKAKAGILRDMTDLAVKSGHVNDPDALFKELVAREEAAPTAIGQGVALLHPRFHDPYLFDETFIAYGRAERPVFFGAPNGEATRHFFLVCSTDHSIHMHILARLAMLAHGTDLMEKLDEATESEEIISIITEAESDYKT